MINTKRHTIFVFLFFTATFMFAQQKELSLQECVEQAVQNNTNILIANSDVALASSRRDEITAKLLPQLSLSADYRYYNELPTQLIPASMFGGPAGVYKETQFGVPHVLNGNIQGNMPIYNQTILSGRTTAKIGAELAEIQYRKTREDVILDISNVYYTAQIAANQIIFMHGNIKNLEQLIATTTLLYVNQMAKQSDADKLKLQKSILDAQISTAEANYQQLLSVLKYQMGQSQNDSITIQMHPSSELLLTGNETNTATDLLVMQKLQQLLNSEMDGIYAGRYPTLAVYGSYGLNGYATTGDKSFDKYYPINYIGIQLSISLFDGGTISSKVDQKNLDVQKMALKEKMLIEKNVMDKKNTQNQFAAHKKSVAMQEENILLAEKLYTQTQLQFKEGVASITDVLQADSALRDAQTNYLTALAKFRMTELEWKKVTGNL